MVCEYLEHHVVEGGTQKGDVAFLKDPPLNKSVDPPVFSCRSILEVLLNPVQLSKYYMIPGATI